MKVLGLDIGHCISAGAYFDENSKRPYRIEGKDSQKTIVTQLMLTNEQLNKLKKNLNGKGSPGYKFLETLGELKIGEDVKIQTEGTRVFRYFKIHSAAFNELYGEDEQEKKELCINHGTLMACFCYALLNQYIESNGTNIKKEDKKELKLIIGCPATEKWTSAKAKKEYAELVKKATGVKEVEIVPESRGALFGVANSEKKISVAKGVIVFDFGSSTADCTYMLLGKRLAEFSWDLGASYIEKEMLKVLRNIAEKYRESGFTPFFEKSVLNKLREIKEKYFRGEYKCDEPGEYTIRFKNAVGEVAKKEHVDIYDDFMKEVLFERTISIACGETGEKTGSWSELCEEFFREAKSIIIEKEKLPVDAIVLTGGASQMGFIKEKCYDVFKIEPVNDKNVEYAVSDGLAWVSASDEKYPEFFEKAKEEIRKKEGCKTEVFVAEFQEKTFDFIQFYIEKSAEAWLKDSEFTTMNQLKDIIRKVLSQEKVKNYFNQDITSSILSKLNESVDKNLPEILNGYIAQLYTAEINDRIKFNAENNNKIEINPMKINLSEAVNKVDIDTFTKRCANGAKRVLVYGVSVFTLGLFDYTDELEDGIKEEKAAQKEKVLTEKEKKSVYDQIVNSYKTNEDKKKNISNYLKDDININNVISDFIDAKVEKAFRVAMLKDFEKKGWSD